MNIKQILLIVFAHRYIAVLTFLLVLAGGITNTWLTPKTYSANTDLLVDFRADPIAGTITVQPNYMATQVAILTSERVAIGVVKRLRIPETPSLVNDWKQATKGSIPIENYYANLLRRGLLVEPLRGSNVIRLTYEGADPKFVTAVINTYAQSYVDLTIDLRVEPVRQYATWFEERIKSLRDNVEAAQNKLSDYQREKGIVGSDQRVDAESQRLDALLAQLVTLQGEGISINSRQKTVEQELSPDMQGSAQVQNIRADINRAQTKLTELSVGLGPNHPQRVQLELQIEQLKQQLAQEMVRVSGGAKIAKTTVGLREGQLRSEIEVQKQRVLALRAERDQLAVLAQDVEAAKKIYDAVLQRSNQLNLEKQTDQANVSILSPAIEPNAPSKPNIPKYVSASILAAFAAAIGITFLLEMFNRKVRVIEDVMIEDIPVLGVIERRVGGFTFRERLVIFKKFFTKRRLRKELVASSRLAGLS